MINHGSVICIGAAPNPPTILGQRSMYHKQTAICRNCGDAVYRLPEEEKWHHGLRPIEAKEV